jgi:hypothetical protein
LDIKSIEKQFFLRGGICILAPSICKAEALHLSILIQIKTLLGKPKNRLVKIGTSKIKTVIMEIPQSAV